jgi:EmrB/QacA subfamily drug resistance transporter
VFLSGSVVTVALASIGLELNLSPGELQWVMNAELLPLAALTLVAGALGDRFGRKRMFLGGIALFGVGAVGTAVAPGWAALIGARFLAGLGEALVLPNGLSLLGQAFPADSKARAVGIWSAVAAVASAVGPAIAGAMIDRGTWRSAFLMPLPIVIAALVLGSLWIPNDVQNDRSSVDIAGAILSTIGLGGLGASLTRLTDGAGLSMSALGPLTLGALSLAVLVRVERRLGDRAMLPPALFQSRSVVGANLFTLLLYGPFTVVLTLIPFFMIRGVHLSPVLAGVAFIPLQVLITVVSPLAGMLCRRFGRRPPLIVGGVITALACALALRIEPEASYWYDIFPPILLLAIGMSLAIAPLATLVLTSVDPDRAGTAAGINSAVSRAGGLLAVALLGGVLQQREPKLTVGFQASMAISAAVCVLAALAALVIEPGPHVDFRPAD